MAAIKENCVKVGHFAASEADCPELSVPPKPISNPKINLCPVELPYPDGNHCVAAALRMEFPHCKQAADLLPAQNGSIVIKSAMKEGDLVVVVACPALYNYGCSSGPLLTLGRGCPSSPSPNPTPCLHSGIKNGSQVLPQGVLGIGYEAQGQHDSSQVNTEAVKQDAGHVRATPRGSALGMRRWRESAARVPAARWLPTPGGPGVTASALGGPDEQPTPRRHHARLAAASGDRGQGRVLSQLTRWARRLAGHLPSVPGVSTAATPSSAVAVPSGTAALALECTLNQGACCNDRR
ncbi:hypothetical protein DUI87_11282 [Hirundo rustica rustica]|uniref:Uncharacterized protein n=1 Tax=Hirundo rustica rustica TaxID=333673 RepID=A0A3M0KYF7_HIRRU|nr:hypothetical protein DUI87_11282 [Hirundo rustica rustica]